MEWSEPPWFHVLGASLGDGCRVAPQRRQVRPLATRVQCGSSGFLGEQLMISGVSKLAADLTKIGGLVVSPTPDSKDVYGQKDVGQPVGINMGFLFSHLVLVDGSR